MILFPVFIIAYDLSAQSITGTWEGVMGDEFIQINIKENHGILCGYTYDHLINNNADHCKAYFTGYYDRIYHEWVIKGNTFIENSGSHVLMQIWIWQINRAEKSVVGATVATESFSGINIRLRRVSAVPTLLPGGLTTCLNEPPKNIRPVIKTPVKKNILPKPKAQKPPHRKPATTKETNNSLPDDLKKQAVPLIVSKRDTSVLQKMIIRKKNAISLLHVNVQHIKLAVYDNGIVDGDTVSIFFNGRLLINKQLLSEKPIIMDLDLDKSIPVNEIILYADNLGSIPPNTALIVVTAGDKRYELHSSANLQENAMLQFDYNPQ